MLFWLYLHQIYGKFIVLEKEILEGFIYSKVHSVPGFGKSENKEKFLMTMKMKSIYKLLKYYLYFEKRQSASFLLDKENRKGEEEMKKENHEIICVKLRNSKNTETCILECYGYEHAKKTIENQIEVIKDDWHVVIDSPIVEQIVSELYYESDQYKTGKAMDIFKNYCETKIKEFEPYLYTDEYGNSRKAEVLLEYSYFRGYKDGLIVDAPEIIDSQDGIPYTAKNSNMIPIDCSMITFVELVKQMDFKYISDKCYENILEYWDEIFMTEILEINNDEIQDENEVEL